METKNCEGASVTRFFGKIFEIRPIAQDKVKHIGRRLKSVREVAGLTQAALAARLGMQQSAVSRIENQSDIRMSTLRQYIEGLGATLRIDARFEGRHLASYGLEMGDFDFDSVDDNQLVLPIVGDDHFPAVRDVVFSVKPYYSQKIESGEKTVELRRRFPADVPPGTIALIYSTSPTSALTGIAEIEDVVVKSSAQIWRDFRSVACIEKSDFDDYFAGVERACAIKLRRARALRRSLPLNELRERFSFEPPQSYLYARPQLREAISYECAEVPD
jgi:predicted transcriptional regulator/DNA-binding XRE family transcriptional regulator